MPDNPIFSYTNRDYESTRQESISKIPFMSKGDWTDTNSSDPGIIILDHVHALVDMMQFYMDHNALESFLSTAKERKNIFRLARQLGYNIRCAKGSKVMVKFSTNKTYNSPYTIPKNTVLTTSGTERIPFLTTEDLIIYSGILSAEVLCVQGSLVEFPYYGTGFSSLDGGLNSEDQTVLLENLGIDLDSIEIEDDKGYIWKKVDNVFLSEKGDRTYSAELLYDGYTLVRFGNDERGYNPTTTDLLNIKYIYSLGSKGSIPNNSINTIARAGKFTTESGTTVTDINVINLEGSVGGTDPESSIMIREQAPAIIKSQDRAVTLRDFEALAKRIPGVLDAKAYDINTSPEDCLYYEVKVLILPDSEYSRDILQTEVYNYLYERSTPPTVLSIIMPNNKLIDITAKVIIENSYTEDYINYEIRKSLTDYFNNLSNTIGISISRNILLSLISKIAGVLYVESFLPTSDVLLEALEIPTLGEVTLDIVRRNT